MPGEQHKHSCRGPTSYMLATDYCRGIVSCCNSKIALMSFSCCLGAAACANQMSSTGRSAPPFPLSGGRFTTPSVNHDRDAISIRWEDLLPLGYCRVTGRVDGGAANCQERISAVELQSAWGGLKTGASGLHAHHRAPRQYLPGDRHQVKNPRIRPYHMDNSRRDGGVTTPARYSIEERLSRAAYAPCWKVWGAEWRWTDTTISPATSRLLNTVQLHQSVKAICMPSYWSWRERLRIGGFAYLGILSEAQT